MDGSSFANILYNFGKKENFQIKKQPLNNKKYIIKLELLLWSIFISIFFIETLNLFIHCIFAYKKFFLYIVVINMCNCEQ